MLFSFSGVLVHIREWLRQRHSYYLATFLILLSIPAYASSISAADESTDTRVAVSNTITGDDLERIRKQIESDPDLDADAKAPLLNTCDKVGEAIARATRLEKQTPIDRAAIDAVAEEKKQQQENFDTPLPEVLAEFEEDASLAELSAALAARRPQLEEAKSRLADLEKEKTRRVERHQKIVGDQASHNGRRAELEDELEKPAPADEGTLATTARRALLQARLRSVLAEGPAHQAELSRYEAEKAVGLLRVKIQLAKRDVTYRQQQVEELTKRITAKRSRDAKYISDQLLLFSQGGAVPTPYNQDTPRPSHFSGVLVSRDDIQTAAETAALAKQNMELTRQTTSAAADVVAAQTKLEALRTLRTRTDEKIKRVGLTGAIGLELRRHLRTLENSSAIRQRCLRRQEDMRDLEYQRLSFEDQIIIASVQLREIEQAAEEFGENQQSTSIEWRLTRDRHVTLSALERNSGEYFNLLGELDVTEQEVGRELDEFNTFIRERVLWIRSNRWPGQSDLAELGSTLRWLFSPANWTQVVTFLLKDIQQNLALYILLTVLLSFLVGLHSRVRGKLRSIGSIASRPSCREFEPTMLVAGLTLVLSLTWCLLPGFLCWRLLSGVTTQSFSHAVGEGLLAVTAGFATLNLFRQLCRSAGLGLAHFSWSSSGVRQLQPRLYALMLILLPLLFVENTLHAHQSPSGRGAAERIVFVVSLLVMAHFAFRILHPNKGVFRDYLKLNNQGWAFRLRWVLYIGVVLLPLILVLLAISGYDYTAFELSWRFHVSTWVLIGLFVLRAFLLRWFVVRYRELRMEHAQQRRLVEQQERQSAPAPPEAPPQAVIEDEVDLQQVSDQTQRLIGTGLAILAFVMTWFVWVDVLPALGVMDQWELWSTQVDVMVENEGADGQRVISSEPRVESITVADLLVAIVIAILAMTAARNIPGLLEMTILKRLPLEPASRYAARMVARYVIFVAGMILAGNAIDIGWAKVQWLAAALTVGLGFGLQEIFANFISGLIILFERPVRIGDVVTIGDVSGTVSKIHIRATTITNWDRKEYIVPNKEFVTGRLLNWTLSDQTNRIVINVGVAYGTDTGVARSLLIQAAHDHDNVLRDPGPIATFEQFGDSTLNLVLRCYIPNLDNRLGTITELHEAIDQAFKAADIEISFPQQDLHLRTVPEAFVDKQRS